MSDTMSGPTARRSTREVSIKLQVVDTNTGQVLAQSFRRLNRVAGTIIRPMTLLRNVKEAAEECLAVPAVSEQLTPWVKGEDVPHRKGVTDGGPR